jgi:Ca-activated chloride channel family protein
MDGGPVSGWLPDWPDLMFAWPWLLCALPLPWVARALLPAARDAGAALRVPYGPRLDGVASRRRAHGRAGGVPLLAGLAWALLCVAAARPQQLGAPVAPPQAGRDMVLAVDLSGSMGDEDMELGGRLVDRLTAAKAVIADFLDRRAGDRVGLVVFGQRAYALAPMTLDLDSVRQQLDDSVVGLAGRETALGDAIGLAVKRLAQQPTGQRVLVLLTDGVNTAGLLDPLKAAELAHDNGVRIYAIAFGGSGGGISVFGLPIQLPGGGDDVDEATLRRVAALTGGKAFRARDAGELAGIYAAIDKLEPVARAARPVRPRIERYPWPLAIALLCALLAFARPAHPGRRGSVS